MARLRTRNRGLGDLKTAGSAIVERVNAILLGRLGEQVFQLLQLLRVLRSEVVGLREVLVQVIELPLVLFPVARRVILPPREGMLGIGLPTVCIHGPIAENLEVLRGPALKLWVGEASEEAGAFQRLLLHTVDARGHRHIGGLENRRHDIHEVKKRITRLGIVLDLRRPADNHRIAGAA